MRGIGRILAGVACVLALGAHGAQAQPSSPAPFHETQAEALRPRLATIEGRGLVLTPQALYRFQPDSEAWTVFTRENGLPAPPLRGLSLAEDDLWAFGEGVSFTSSKFDDWQLYRPGEGYPGTIVFDVEADEDYAYAGTDSGAARFDRYVLEWEAVAGATRLLSGSIVDVAVGDDRVWFALHNGVAEYRKATESTRIDSLLGNLVSPRVLALRQTTQHLWAITDAGVARYDKSLETWTSYRPGVDLPEAKVHRATLVGEDLYLATDDGLWRYQTANGIWRRDEHDADMPGERVFGFTRERGLWVVTERAFAWFDENAGRWIDFTAVVPVIPEEGVDIGWTGDALLVIGRDRIAYAPKSLESNPNLLAFHEQPIVGGGTVISEGDRWRPFLDDTGLGLRRSRDESLALKGGATFEVEAETDSGDSDFADLVTDTRLDLTLNGRFAGERSLNGVYDTTDPDNAAYLLSYRGSRDDLLRNAGAGEIDPQLFNTELVHAAGLRGGWLRAEAGGRSAEARRRLITADTWAGERRSYPGREIFYGRSSVYRLERRNLVPNSETVRLDRETLLAAVDYTIDWEHGSFTLAEHLLLADDSAIEVTYLYEIASDTPPETVDSTLSDDRMVYAGEIGAAPNDRFFVGLTGTSWSDRSDHRAGMAGVNARIEEKGTAGFLRITPELTISSGDSTGHAAAVGLSARHRGLEVTGRHRDLGAGFSSLEDLRTRLGRLRRDTRASARWDLPVKLQAIVDWDETRSDITAPLTSSDDAPVRPSLGDGREALLTGTLRFLGNGLPNLGVRHGRVLVDSLGERREKWITRGELELNPDATRLRGTGVKRLWLRAFFQRSRSDTDSSDIFGNTERTTDHSFIRLNGSSGNPLTWNLAWEERWTYRPQSQGVHGLAREQDLDLTFQSRPHPALDTYLRWEADRDLYWREHGGPDHFGLSRQLTWSTQLYPGLIVPRLRPLSLRLDLAPRESDAGGDGEASPGSAGLWQSVTASRHSRNRYAALETRVQVLTWMRLVDVLRSEHTRGEDTSMVADGHYRLFEHRIEMRPEGGLAMVRAISERRETETIGASVTQTDMRVLRFAAEWSQTWGGGFITYAAIDSRRTRDGHPKPWHEWTPQARVTWRRAQGEMDASLGATYRFSEEYKEYMDPDSGAEQGAARLDDHHALTLATTLSVRPVRILTLKFIHNITFERGQLPQQTINLRLLARA
jgi:hypothetical protein